MNTLIKFGALPLFFGAILLYVQYDRATNYEEVTATVTGIEETCYMKKKIGKRSWTTDEGPCEIVRQIHENHPEFKDYDLIRNVNVEFEYISPADDGWHTGKLEQSQHPDGSDIRYGDSLLVLAHKEKPETTATHSFWGR